MTTNKDEQEKEIARLTDRYNRLAQRLRAHKEMLSAEGRACPDQLFIFYNHATTSTEHEIREHTGAHRYLALSKLKNILHLAEYTAKQSGLEVEQ